MAMTIVTLARETEQAGEVIEEESDGDVIEKKPGGEVIEEEASGEDPTEAAVWANGKLAGYVEMEKLEKSTICWPSTDKSYIFLNVVLIDIKWKSFWIKVEEKFVLW